MKEAFFVSRQVTHAFFSAILAILLTSAGCIVVSPAVPVSPGAPVPHGAPVSTGSDQPACQPGQTGDPILCVKVDVVAGDGSGCTVASGSKKCSATTANKPCPFNSSATRCRTVVTNSPVAGACDCQCTN